MLKISLNTVLLTKNRLRGLFLILLVGSLLTACETSEINTRSATVLPIRAGQLLVIYEQGNLDRHFPVAAVDQPAEGRVRMAAALGRAVESRIPAGFIAKGVNTRFVLLQDGQALPPAAVATSSVNSYVLRIRAFKDVQVCKETERCTHQMTVRASVLRSGSGAVLWSTEFEEAVMSSVTIDERRFELLADRILYTMTQVIRAPN